MGGPINKLTDLAIKNTKPGQTARRISDGGGMFLEIMPNGSKYWRMAYGFDKKQKLLAIGVYPQVSVQEAREKARDARDHLAAGRNPGLLRSIARFAGSSENSFQAVAVEWLERFKHEWTESHYKGIFGRLNRELFPWLGARPVHEITAPELLPCLRRIEARGHLENAHRAHTNAGQVFMYAIATGRAERNPAADLRGAIPRPRVKHMYTILDPRQVGILMAAIITELQALTGGVNICFQGFAGSRPISDATMTNALRRMGYGKDELHVHGFRAMARTLIRQELGFAEEPIERHLGHAVKGFKAYHPEILLSLLFYGYATGVFSSRKIDQATYDSVAFRFISVNTHPDHDTIASFRKRFLDQLKLKNFSVLPNRPIAKKCLLTWISQQNSAAVRSGCRP